MSRNLDSGVESCLCLCLQCREKRKLHNVLQQQLGWISGLIRMIVQYVLCWQPTVDNQFGPGCDVSVRVREKWRQGKILHINPNEGVTFKVTDFGRTFRLSMESIPMRFAPPKAYPIRARLPVGENVHVLLRTTSARKGYVVSYDGDSRKHLIQYQSENGVEEKGYFSCDQFVLSLDHWLRMYDK